MKYFAWFLGMSFLVMSACTIDDEDRCPKGFYWENDLKSCLEEVEEIDAGEEECVIDEGVGLGEECMDDGDCSAYTANFCQKNPLNPPEDPGACTIDDCVPADCVCEYQCCDCSAVDLVPFGAICINEANTGQVVGAGCTCE